MKAEMYTKTNCPYCTQAKALLKSKNIEYTEYMISPGFNEDKLGPNQLYATREQLLERAPSARTVPQIWLDGEYIGGYVELEKYFSKK